MDDLMRYVEEWLRGHPVSCVYVAWAVTLNLLVTLLLLLREVI